MAPATSPSAILPLPFGCPTPGVCCVPCLPTKRFVRYTAAKLLSPVRVHSSWSTSIDLPSPQSGNACESSIQVAFFAPIAHCVSCYRRAESSFSMTRYSTMKENPEQSEQRRETSVSTIVGNRGWFVVGFLTVSSYSVMCMRNQFLLLFLFRCRRKRSPASGNEKFWADHASIVDISPIAV